MAVAALRLAVVAAMLLLTIAMAMLLLAVVMAEALLLLALLRWLRCGVSTRAAGGLGALEQAQVRDGAGRHRAGPARDSRKDGGGGGRSHPLLAAAHPASAPRCNACRRPGHRALAERAWSG